MKSILFAMSLFAAAPAFSAELTPAAVPNGVITSVEAVPLSGGFNPSFAGVMLRGTIKAGNNACEAQQFSVHIEMIAEEGFTLFVPVLERKADASDLVCNQSIDDNFKGLSFHESFNLPSDLVPYATIQDVYELGHAVTVGEVTVIPQ